MIADFIINILNLIIKALGAILSFLFSVLPPSPFKIIDTTPIAKYMKQLNYFIPVSEMIVFLEVWIGCVAAYYIYQVVLRWVKAVQ